MASQSMASSSLDSRTDFIEIRSFVQGLHAYLRRVGTKDWRNILVTARVRQQ